MLLNDCRKEGLSPIDMIMCVSSLNKLNLRFKKTCTT